MPKIGFLPIRSLTAAIAALDRGRIARAVREEDRLGVHAEHLARRWSTRARRSRRSRCAPGCAGCCAWRRSRRPRSARAGRCAGGDPVRVGSVVGLAPASTAACSAHLEARSRPSVAGALRALATSERGSESSSRRTQRRQPSVRTSLGQPARVDAVDRDHAVLAEPGRERAIRAPVARGSRDISLITNASAQARLLSSSSSATP